jgi:carboxymethylenebutenolidase
MEIVSERVEIPLGEGGVMGGYLARPKGPGPFPGVIVYMEIFGVNAHIRDVTERVARESYVALAPDVFHRTAPGIELGYDEGGMGKGIELLMRVRADEAISDARDAVAFLRERPEVRGSKLGAMGFCMGGHLAFLTACEAEVAAAASFYGGGIAAPQGPGGGPGTLSRTPKIRGRVLCLFGGRDAMIPAAQVEAIRAALAARGGRDEVVVYPEADHGFFCDQRATYHEASARDAWERVKQLFASELKASR